ncbi:endonuclease V [Polycladomyces subterraneus]|uniref:Endonuclease V n=1 Tax=Polycladomyces subterraneus TaxID=1016997 RepID=A0ABT8IM01_9BACL|nr:endonuclease V [Polycladomyces subterraneus]MDN4593813.1 endonuclease V [Polycladomyces subterraneus]
MEPVMMHRWDLDPVEAERLQRGLSAQVIRTDQLHDVRYVAGVDVAYDPETDKQLAAVVVLNARSLQVVETTVAEEQVSFPYRKSRLKAHGFNRGMKGGVSSMPSEEGA